MTLPEERDVVGRPAWVGARDAALKLVADGARAQPDDLSRLERRLARLNGRDGPGWPFHVYQLGYDVGRHVFAKRVPDDTLQSALSSVGDGLDEAAWSHLTVSEIRHREAVVEFRPAASKLEAAIHDAFVGGVIAGTLAEALNTKLRLEPDGDQIRIVLGSGPPRPGDEVPT